MDKEKMNNDPQNTSEEITERIEEMIEEETETGAGTVSISDRLREAEADENDYDADVEDGYDEAEYDEADGEVDGENEYGEASEDAEYVEDEYSEEEEEEDDDDEPRIVVNPKVVKVASLILFSGIILVFASIAWFTMNQEVGTSGMGVAVGSDSYQIVPLDGITSIYQDYYNYMPSGQDTSMVWKMTAENNMENYTGDAGISPGSFGTISFYVKPRDASVDLDLSFEIVGYKYTETTHTTEGEDPVTTKSMTQVSNELQGYLAGHIFLFETRTPVYDDPDSENKKIISYMYSDPILSTTEIAKVISNRTFYKTDENTPVNIYWVWPKTLSTLVDATDNSYVTIEPFCENSAYTAVVSNVTSYPARFLYQYSDTETTLTPALISSQYETYGDLYDRADNEIGLNVSYITLKMTTTETAQTTP